MRGVNNVFHVSMLWKYLHDPEHKIDLESITVEQNLTVEFPRDPEHKIDLESITVSILDSSKRVTRRRRTIKYVKVLWLNQSEREATWELEDQVRKKYIELFEADLER
ncbi:uncharacterized protein LOC133928042 [Phragmites australis]|uniref:uncharacterized protein LOC133928042 n=1 Tax=Phragmites australis TaxID=29695 RepID=UPI002D76F044|nr:uncharacterized protein LOC133928042 [Phragmites australis]